MITTLKDMLSRSDAWPDEDQEALVEAARGIEAETTGVYQASAVELASIDRSLGEARAGRFADSQALAEVHAKFRGG
jgi:predicted transcriptional regulator